MITNIITFALLLLPIFILLIKKKRESSKRLPPGSLGIPIIGHSLQFFRSMRTNTTDKWLKERVEKCGPVSKLSLLGKPTLFIYGQDANKFIFGRGATSLGNNQPPSVQRVMGQRNLLELSGEDHKRVRGALMSFLTPNSLKQYVGKMDEIIKKHLEMHWHGKQTVTKFHALRPESRRFLSPAVCWGRSAKDSSADKVKTDGLEVWPLMRTLTFDIMCSLLMGVEKGAYRDELVKLFEDLMDGVWSIPINLPFTRYNRSLQASTKIQILLKGLLNKKRIELEQRRIFPHHDLISSLLSIKDDDGENVMTEKEIIENVMLVMVGGHDTSSILLTFLVRLLGSDPSVYAAILQEQKEIAKSKASGELLAWEDLSKMKYTWNVAMETLRTIPPIIGNFRTVLEDIQYDGYLIPKGWQVFWAASMTHMDNNIFPNPSKFDPSRFKNQAAIPPYSFVAFGGGPRVCPGYEFAKVETLVAIHYFVTRFTWKLCCDDLFMRDPLPVPTAGLPIQITPKKEI
ncbi:Cytochrome P450 [Dillenia turbinata]|uniref:Cytochrome P450 n=1 Tax=Dillenia turbinata TaxID=194707 RepID=A0AAN8UM46_9MAGN